MHPPCLSLSLSVTRIMSKTGTESRGWENFLLCSFRKGKGSKSAKAQNYFPSDSSSAISLFMFSHSGMRESTYHLQPLPVPNLPPQHASPTPSPLPPLARLPTPAYLLQPFPIPAVPPRRPRSSSPPPPMLPPPLSPVPHLPYPTSQNMPMFASRSAEYSY